MPTYEYLCSKCGLEFEKFQSMADRALTVCPKELCKKKPWGKGKVKRVIGAGAGLIFKGSGFYITDYRSDSYKEAAKSESKAAGGSSGEGKSGTAAGDSAKSKGDASKTKKSPPAKKNKE